MTYLMNVYYMPGFTLDSLWRMMQLLSLAEWNLNWVGKRDGGITGWIIGQVGSAGLKELKKVSRLKGLNWGLRE